MRPPPPGPLLVFSGNAWARNQLRYRLQTGCMEHGIKGLGDTNYSNTLIHGSLVVIVA